MNQKQAISILAIIKSAYPNFYKDMNDEDIKTTVELWSTMFVNDNPSVVTEAVKALICTLKYPPTIADVKEKIRLITQPEEMTEQEAWSKVRGAMSYYTAVESYNNLPDILQKLVGSPNQLREWAQMNQEHIETVVKSNFLRSYTAKMTRERSIQALPESTKIMIEGLGEKFKMLEG